MNACPTCVSFREISELLRELIAAGITCNGRLKSLSAAVTAVAMDGGCSGSGSRGGRRTLLLLLLRGLGGFLRAARALAGTGTGTGIAPFPQCNAAPLWRILLGGSCRHGKAEDVLDAAVYALRLAGDISTAGEEQEGEEGEIEWMDADQFVASLPGGDVPLAREAVGMLTGGWFPPLHRHRHHRRVTFSPRLCAKISAVLGREEIEVAASVAALTSTPGFLWLASRETATDLLQRAPPCTYAIRLSRTMAPLSSPDAPLFSLLKLVISFVSPAGVVSHRLLDRCCASSPPWAPLSLGAVLASETEESWGGIPAARYRPLPVRADPTAVNAVCEEARFSRFISDGCEGSGSGSESSGGYLVAEEEREGEA